MALTTIKKPPAPITVKPVDGLTVRAGSKGTQLAPEEMAQRLAEFRAKYPQRTLRKGQKTIAEQISDDRNRR